MSLHMNRIAGLDPKSFPHAIKAADDQRRGDGRRNEAAIESAENSSLSSVVPTLDDFGGRSDALGG
jgi:hypothetical protein